MTVSYEQTNEIKRIMITRFLILYKMYKKSNEFK